MGVDEREKKSDVENLLLWRSLVWKKGEGKVEMKARDIFNLAKKAIDDSMWSAYKRSNGIIRIGILPENSKVAPSNFFNKIL